MLKDFLAKRHIDISSATDSEIYHGIVEYTKTLIAERGYNEGKKKLYYVSAEFLVGRLLINNLMNLGICDEVADMLKSQGRDIEKIADCEAEPSLGNGGLGRLAMCYADSAATMGLTACGVGLAYRLGLFRQVFSDNRQTEHPDPWIKKSGWLTETDTRYTVPFADFDLTAKLYRLDVTGEDGKSNALCLFEAEGVDEGIVGGGISFDKRDIKRNLTLFLYPDDSDADGKKLRLCQQYFMVCAGANLIIDEALAKGSNLYDLPDYAVVQINDTHPALIIPELIRLLTERGISFEDSAEIVRRVCAYTNHTIMAEALEKWRMEDIEAVSPKIADIIRRLDTLTRRCDRCTDIITEGRANMAHLAVHFSFSVNGVAPLHTRILKESTLKGLFALCPDKFHGITNGITFRRWLTLSNPELTALIRSVTGDGFLTDADRLSELKMYLGDSALLSDLDRVKRHAKERFCDFMMAKQGVKLLPDSVFDIQAKRLHEYKRQQMNALYIIEKYLEIREGILPERHRTFIFAAKAAPSYVMAKDVIHLILCLEKLISADRVASKYMTVTMVENYNVTVAEHLIPACDISEQISLASKEASGTGNMKFMLNGAVTLGTADGANVEIARLVGNDNIYLFGKSADEVIDLFATGRYNPCGIYANNPAIRLCVDFITNPEMLRIGNGEMLRRLQNELKTVDRFMTLGDFAAYSDARDRIFADYEDRNQWQRKALTNIASSSYFSSDRSVSEYNRKIWKL